MSESRSRIIERATFGCVALAAASALFAAIGAMGGWLVPDANPFGWRDGRIGDAEPPVLMQQRRPAIDEERRTRSWVPYGNSFPTVVSFPIEGESQCLIQGAEFIVKKRIATPERPFLAGEMRALRICFTKDHLHDRSSFKLAFQTPRHASSKEWVSAEVSVVEPKWVGSTYIGTLVVYYNGTEKKDIDNVELDVLARLPAQ